MTHRHKAPTASRREHSLPWFWPFAAGDLLGTPRDRIVKQPTPGGHIGLFMGAHTLAEVWPEIGRGIGAVGAIA